MRYADGPQVRCDVHVAAAPDRVWELVADIGVPARFSPELQRVRWLDGADRPAVGCRFEGHNRNPALGQWRTISHVVELDPPRAFAWAVVDPDSRFAANPTDPTDPANPTDPTDPTDPRAAMATWRFDLTPESGGVRLRHGVRLGPARSGLSLAIDRAPEKEEALVAYRLADLRTGIEQTLRGIRALAEQPR